MHAREPKRETEPQTARARADALSPVLRRRLPAGNRALAARLAAGAPAQARSATLARMAVLQNGRLVKRGRLDFAPDLQAAMPVQAGQHRAHVIPYDELARAVIDPVNRARRTGSADWLNAVWNLILTVYPSGADQQRHPGSATLAAVAVTHHQLAIAAYDEIVTLALAGPLDDLVAAVNMLIGALNNSPDNLRPGSGSTNSSIHEGLDPQPRHPDPFMDLLKGTPIVTPSSMRGQHYTTHKLPADTTVLRVAELDERMIWSLLTTTSTERNTVHAFSSGLKLQSSDYAAMRSGNMTNTIATHLAIQVPDRLAYFLFEI